MQEAAAGAFFQRRTSRQAQTWMDAAIRCHSGDGKIGRSVFGALADSWEEQHERETEIQETC